MLMVGIQRTDKKQIEANETALQLLSWYQNVVDFAS